jgi:hypothetical protein
VQHQVEVSGEPLTQHQLEVEGASSITELKFSAQLERATSR